MELSETWQSAPDSFPRVGNKIIFRLWNGHQDTGYFFYDFQEDAAVMTQHHPSDGKDDIVCWGWCLIKDWKNV